MSAHAGDFVLPAVNARQHHETRSTIRTAQEGRIQDMTGTAFLSQQRESYQQEFLALRQTFERTGDGSAMIRRRALSVDGLFKLVWKQTLGKDLDRPGIAVAATG